MIGKLILIIIGFTLLVAGFYFVLDSGRMHPIEIIIDEKDKQHLDNSGWIVR